MGVHSVTLTLLLTMRRAACMYQTPSNSHKLPLQTQKRQCASRAGRIGRDCQDVLQSWQMRPATPVEFLERRPRQVIDFCCSGQGESTGYGD